MPKSKLSTADIEAICTRYERGETSAELAAVFGVSSPIILKNLHRNGVAVTDPHKPKLSQEQQAEVCRRYIARESANKLATTFGVNINIILKTLRKHSIQERTVSERHRLAAADSEEMSRRGKLGGQRSIEVRNLRPNPKRINMPSNRLRTRYTANHSLFDTIDRATSAYLMGFIAADGCIIDRDNSPRLNITLAIKDTNHLYQLRSILGSDHPIRLDKRTARLEIASRDLTTGLVAQGIHPRKTLTYTWPTHLKRNLIPHFVRGYHDGDGCFSVRDKGYVSSYTVGTEAFLSGLRQYLADTINLPVRKLRPCGRVWRLDYHGNRQMARFAHLLYDDATVYLPRKRDKVTHLLQQPSLTD